MIGLETLALQRFAVLGLGRSGMAAALALARSGKDVIAWDDNPVVRDAAVAAGIGVQDISGAALADAEALILSPGIPHTYPAPHPAAVRARAAGIPIIGDVELLFQAYPKARFVGITGTNGKSTTTALIGHVLERAGFDCQVGGNLGTPVLEFSPLPAGGVYVLEMSSYQLDLTPSMAFDAAVLLNITPDHLERHGGFHGYVAAKRRIFDSGSGAVIIGIDDKPCIEIADEIALRGQTTIGISGGRRVRGGVSVVDAALYDDSEGDAPAPQVDLRQALALPGAHNGQNAAAAYAAARALGIDPATITRAILDFPGLAHRQERIAVIGGITFVNDSKATNPEAAAKALASYDTIYWIAGGRPKQAGLDALFPYLPRVRHAFLIGEAEAAFAEALNGRVPLHRVGTLDRAVHEAHRHASADSRPGVTVLLSPACASFDQFPNFEVRGEAFRALVEALK